MALDGQEMISHDRVPARYKGEFLEVEKEKIEFIDVIPRQVVGTSASLIPFIAYDEANRALMGTHMQCQAVPLVKPTSPVVGTGMESIIAEVMGRVVRAPMNGTISYVDSTTIVFEGENGKKITYPIESFRRTSQATSYTQKAFVVSGQKVKRGDILIDGPSTQAGELS